jgi:nucleoside phosphorylase
MVLVVFALRAEARIFQRRLHRKRKGEVFFEGVMGGSRVGICFVGIRAAAIADLETAIQRLAPTLVISSGFAGATRSLLKPGDFLLASNYTTAHAEIPVGSLVDATGLFCSVEQINGALEKKSLGEFSVAVDMESIAIATVCDRHQIPLITARMISDSRDENIPSVFIGGKLRSVKDAVAAGEFALRMLRLTRLLADRLTRLISFVTRADDRSHSVGITDG